jgi:hypothetical protein
MPGLGMHGLGALELLKCLVRFAARQKRFGIEEERGVQLVTSLHMRRIAFAKSFE